MRLRTLTRVLIVLLTVSGLALVAIGWHVGNGSESLSARARSLQPAGPRTPSLYTNANSVDVFARPARHLGAHVDLEAAVLGARRTGGTVLVAARVGRQRLAIRVFDPAFRAPRGHTIHVIGTVRGPLGDRRRVPGLRPSGMLGAGLAVIDASAASTG